MSAGPDVAEQGDTNDFMKNLINTQHLSFHHSKPTQRQEGIKSVGEGLSKRLAVSVHDTHT